MDEATPASSAAGRPTGRGLSLWLVEFGRGDALLADVAAGHGLFSAVSDQPPARNAARAALRILLAGFIGPDAARRPFRIGPHGKPSLAATSSPLDFSLAHCDAAALIAMSTEGPIGIDIETPRTLRIADVRRASLIAAAISLSPQSPLPASPQDAGFLQAWTRLEALAKATGDGIGTVLERIRRTGSPIGPALPGTPPLHVRDLEIDIGAPVYAAVAGPGRSIAAPAPPAVSPLPLDRPWLERWIAGGCDLRPG